MKLHNRVVALIAGVFLLGGGIALADEVIIASGKAELPYKGVSVKLTKEGMVYWTSSGGTEAHRELADIKKIEIAGEADFNKAEKSHYEARNAEAAKDEAGAKKKYSEALNDYQAALRSPKQLVKDIAAARIEVLAAKSDRFDLALDIWARKVTTATETAAKSKPAPTGIDPKSKILTDAVTKLQGLAKATSNTQYQRLYYGMVADIQRVQGDTEAENKTLEIIAALGGNPEEIAQLQVRLAKVDVDKKQYDAATERMGKAGNLDSLPDAIRADAYFILAECKGAKVTASSPAETLKDTAVDYMRVVAGFPASTHAAPSLLKVAELLESMKDAETALKTYQAVVKEYPGTPAAQSAKQHADRLAKSMPKG